MRRSGRQGLEPTETSSRSSRSAGPPSFLQVTPEGLLIGPRPPLVWQRYFHLVLFLTCSDCVVGPNQTIGCLLRPAPEQEKGFASRRTGRVQLGQRAALYWAQ